MTAARWQCAPGAIQTCASRSWNCCTRDLVADEEVVARQPLDVGHRLLDLHRIFRERRIRCHMQEPAVRSRSIRNNSSTW